MRKSVFLFFNIIVTGIFFLGITRLEAQEKPNYICGVATGFPPYQFIDQAGKSSGLDVEVTELVFKKAGLKVSLYQDDWEVLLFNLVHKKKMIDMLCGAEITSERQALLDFTVPYYKRRTVLFTLKNYPLKRVEDLYGKIVTGDLHSSFEKILGDKKSNIRIMKTATKEESFKKLKDKSVVAVIAPIEVGLYLSKKLKIETKVFDEGDYPGSPVGIAVKKGDSKLLELLNSALKKLIESGEIDKILKKYGQYESSYKRTKNLRNDPFSLLAHHSN